MADLSWNLGVVARLVGGSLIGEETPVPDRVVIDSRQDVKGALYVALKGERFDGHEFVGDVAAADAAGVMVERSIDGIGVPQIVVSNTLEALQTLGLARRKMLEGQLVAITGSSGKTTTRKLAASILSQRFSTHQPIRNFNNHIGVPLTLLDLEERHETAVLELGCSDFLEIEQLTKISSPDIALVTNVGPAHLEKLGDLNGVARAKGELFLNLEPGAIALVNLDDPHVARMPSRAERRITFGSGPHADIQLVERRPRGRSGQTVVMDLRGETMEALLPLPGEHNARNALAAAAIGVAAGLSTEQIIAGIARWCPSQGVLPCARGTPARPL